MEKENKETTQTEDENPDKSAANAYYYDDSHGYEVYIPDEDDEPTNNDPAGSQT